MTDLERFVAALLAQWKADGGHRGGPIDVGALLDRVMPYRGARRLLGIDISEDYEALVLRLIAGEEGLATTAPDEAGEMARTTMTSKLPDLDTLRLLRSASITIHDEVVERLGNASFGEARAQADATWRGVESAVSGGTDPSVPEESHTTPGDALADEPADLPPDVIPLPVARDATRVAAPREPAGPPPAYLTGPAEFTPPDASCWSCGDALPGDRVVKYCPFCGALQQPPACSGCGTSVERGWKHCPECGIKLTTPG